MNTPILFCDAAPAAATTTTTTQPAEGDTTSSSTNTNNNPSTLLFMMLLMIALFYVMLIRPQQRKEKERRKMIENLRAGAKIVFAGGLMGTIQEAAEKTFKVEIAPGTVIEIARSSVSGVVNSEK